MNFPEELKYSEDHEWVRFEGSDSAFIGLTDYAQKELGDLVFVNLPQAGDELTVGEVLGDVESVKAVSDIHSPVTGVVKAVNEELLDDPASINRDPYGAWLVEVEGITGKAELMDSKAYQQFCQEKDA
jgi:glycine cleavage system H protein